VTTSLCRLIHRWTFRFAAALLILSACLNTPPGDAATYTGSVQLTSGEYIFSERTTNFSFYNGVAFSAGPVGISVSIPITYQSTPWVSYSGSGMIPSGGDQHSEVGGRTHGGQMTLADTVEYDQIALGDPMLHADFELLKERKAIPSVYVTADLKAPLADIDRGFGTGEWDYGAGLSLVKGFGRSLFLIDVTYWVLGDLPDLELHDPVAYSFAAGHTLAAGKYAVLASFSGYSRVLDDVDPTAQVGIGASYSLNSGATLSGNVALGVTESTPDISVSLGWQIGL